MKKIFILFILSCLVLQGFTAEKVFKTLDGTPVSYSSILGQGNTVLFIWTGHCPYCINELKVMNKNENIGKIANFYFVNVGESVSSVSRIAKRIKLKKHITANIILDKDAIIAHDFSIIGVPTFIFIRNGKIIARDYYFDEDTLKKIFKNE